MRAGALATRDAYDRAVCVPWMSPDVVGFVCPRRFDPEPASHVLALLILRLLCANCESSGDGRVGHLQPFCVVYMCEGDGLGRSASMETWPAAEGSGLGNHVGPTEGIGSHLSKGDRRIINRVKGRCRLRATSPRPPNNKRILTIDKPSQDE